MLGGGRNAVAVFSRESWIAIEKTARTDVREVILGYSMRFAELRDQKFIDKRLQRFFKTKVCSGL
jgi:hypothetical protein